MKFTVNKLQLGDRVWAQIVENVGPAECIVSFRGDLVRVRNESLRPLARNDKVLMRVVQISPLSFQLVIPDEKRKAPHLNVTV